MPKSAKYVEFDVYAGQDFDGELVEISVRQLAPATFSVLLLGMEFVVSDRKINDILLEYKVPSKNGAFERAAKDRYWNRTIAA